MPIDADVAFRFMRANYRSGMLDKTGVILGDALGVWMQEEGLDMEDLFQRLDGAGEDQVARLDRLVRFAGPLLRLSSNERMLRWQSRLLDLPRVRAAMIFIVKRILKRMFPSPPHQPRPYVEVLNTENGHGPR